MDANACLPATFHTPGHVGDHLRFKPGNEVFSGEMVLRRATLPEPPPDGGLHNGVALNFGDITVGGPGGCHRPSNLLEHSRNSQGGAKLHLVWEDIGTPLGRQWLNRLPANDAPAGVMYSRRRIGLDDFDHLTRTRVRLFGHNHTRAVPKVGGATRFGINSARAPANFVKVVASERGRKWTPLVDRRERRL